MKKQVVIGFVGGARRIGKRWEAWVDISMGGHVAQNLTHSGTFTTKEEAMAAADEAVRAMSAEISCRYETTGELLNHRTGEVTPVGRSASMN